MGRLGHREQVLGVHHLLIQPDSGKGRAWGRGAGPEGTQPGLCAHTVLFLPGPQAFGVWHVTARLPPDQEVLWPQQLLHVLKDGPLLSRPSAPSASLPRPPCAPQKAGGSSCSLAPKPRKPRTPSPVESWTRRACFCCLPAPPQPGPRVRAGVRPRAAVPFPATPGLSD